MQDNAPEAANSNTEPSAGVADGLTTASPLIADEYQQQYAALSAIELAKQSSSTAGAEAIIRDVWI